MTYQRDELVKRLVERVFGADPGLRAALRRAHPERPPLAFYQLTADLLDKAGLHEDGEWREQEERLLLVVARAIAISGDRDGRGGLLNLSSDPRTRPRLGTTLAEARYSETRLLQLLNASGPALRKHVNLAVDFLAAKGKAYGTRDIVALLGSDARDNEDAVRRDIARDYYRKTKSDSTSQKDATSA